MVNNEKAIAGLRWLFRLCRRKGLAYFFETFHLREDEDEREETQHGQSSPHHIEGHFAPEQCRNHREEVADGRGHEPTAHHHSFVLGRSDLRDERNAHRREQQLGECEDKLSADQPTG